MISNTNKKRELAKRLAAAALRGYHRAGPTSFQVMESPAAVLATENVLEELETFMGETSKD